MKVVMRTRCCGLDQVREPRFFSAPWMSALQCVAGQAYETDTLYKIQEASGFIESERSLLQDPEMTWTQHNLFFSLSHKDVLEFFIKCLHGVCRCTIDCMVFIYQPDGPLNLFSASSYWNNEFLLFPPVSCVHRQQGNDPDREQTWKEDKTSTKYFLDKDWQGNHQRLWDARMTLLLWEVHSYRRSRMWHECESRFLTFERNL